MRRWEAVTPEGRRFQILWTHASLYSYIDDILRISKDLTKIIHSFADPHFLYRLKNVGPPKMWYLSAEEYLVNAIPVILEESFGPLKQTIIQNEQVRCSSSTREEGSKSLIQTILLL